MSTVADIQKRFERVRVADVRGYLLSRGWKRKPSPRPHTICFEDGTDDDGKAIVQVFPDTERYSDYGRCVHDLVRALSVIERRSAEEVLEKLIGFDDLGAEA